MKHPPPLCSFRAKTVHGSGRGKGMGTPTVNLNLADVPATLEEGIYACIVSGTFNGKMEKNLPGAMHFGPRPVFKDTASCEVHVLDKEVKEPPDSVEVHIIARLRDILDFPSEQQLRDQIMEDIAQTRKILGA